MTFDIRATFNGTADSKEKAHQVALDLRAVMAEHGFSGIIEVREKGTNEAFIRDVVRPGEKAGE